MKRKVCGKCKRLIIAPYDAIHAVSARLLYRTVLHVNDASCCHFDAVSTFPWFGFLCAKEHPNSMFDPPLGCPRRDNSTRFTRSLPIIDLRILLNFDARRNYITQSIMIKHNNLLVFDTMPRDAGIIDDTSLRRSLLLLHDEDDDDRWKSNESKKKKTDSFHERRYRESRYHFKNENDYVQTVSVTPTYDVLVSGYFSPPQGINPSSRDRQEFVSSTSSPLAFCWLVWLCEHLSCNWWWRRCGYFCCQGHGWITGACVTKWGAKCMNGWKRSFRKGGIDVSRKYRFDSAVFWV